MNPTLKISMNDMNEWNDVISTNLTSAFLFAKIAVAGEMKKQLTGKIINIGSVLGFMGSSIAHHLLYRQSRTCSPDQGTCSGVGTI